MSGKGRMVDRWLFIFTVLSAGMAFLGWDDSPGVFEIYLKRSLAASGEDLSVKDMAQSYSGKPYALDLGGIRLPITPGRLHVISTRTIRDLLGRHYQGQLILVGRGITVIPSSAAEKGGVSFFEQAGDFLRATVNQPQTRIEMEYFPEPDTVSYQGKQVSFELKHAVKRNGVPVGEATLRYRDAAAPGSVSGEMTVALHVFGTVAFPKAPIKRGQRFDERDVLEREVDLAAFQEELLFTDRMTGVYTASHGLSPDKPIPLKKVARAQFVRSGEKVNITFVKKNIIIGLRGRALGSGGMDERVTVLTDGARRRFQGLVTGDKEVLIELQ